ncbi:hypothetical protein PENSPDRAFT_645989 [Peniophora sp. CONT]|nr:hypothetical protein PENSPDRAFT_645989 [Peniophora sp. CONT]
MPDQARSPPTPPFQSLSGTGCPISLIGHGRARSRMVREMQLLRHQTTGHAWSSASREDLVTKASLHP